jgi:hypothetical protein
VRTQEQPKNWWDYMKLIIDTKSFFLWHHLHILRRLTPTES